MARLTNIAPETGGVPVSAGAPPGSLIELPGQVQYGDVLLGSGTAAGWRSLHGWRDLPEDVEVGDAYRPQAHGTYPGHVHAGALTVTFTYLLRGSAESKARALRAIEQAMPMDGVERPLVVHDGDGPWMRQARVVARDVPQDAFFRVGPLLCSVQLRCADPRRYSVTEAGGEVRLPESSGGLDYPLSYPLNYGESSSGSLAVTNAGSVSTPLRLTFVGPLDGPALTGGGWSLGFNLSLTDGEQLEVDTSAGTVLLNGTADRLYTIRADSDPLELVRLRPGPTNLSLSASGGTGRLVARFHDARM